MQWFTFDSEEGITIHADQAGAIADAENRIESWREAGDYEWPEGVESVGIGLIQPVTKNIRRNDDGEEVWDFTMEPVDPDPLTEVKRLTAEVERLTKGIQAVAELVSNSQGVYGLHQNGDPAPWDELMAGGRFEEWLADFSIAIDAIEAAKAAKDKP